MKKKEQKILLSKLCLFSLLILFFLTHNSKMTGAAQITLSKESYYPGETLQAEITGDFIDNMQESNIALYKQSSNHKIAAESGIINDNTKYLFYTILPSINSEGDYSLKIENIRYYENNVQTSSIIEKNFTIINAGTNAYLSFSPGFISTSKDFSIKIKAYNSAQSVTALLSATGQKNDLSLAEGQEKTAYFSISNVKTFTRTEVKINSYSIKTLISPKISPPNTTSNLTNYTNNLSDNIEDLLSIYPEKIEQTFLSNKEYNLSLAIKNKTFINKNITLRVYSEDSKIKIIQSTINFSKESYFQASIKSSTSINSSIVVDYSGSFLVIPVKISITQNQSLVNYSSGTNCQSLNGQICIEKSETCSGIIRFTEEGSCCIGECLKQESSKTWIIGVILLILVAIVIYFFYKKSKQSPESSPMSIFARKSEAFKKRISPEKEIEVKKSLAKE